MPGKASINAHTADFLFPFESFTPLNQNNTCTTTMLVLLR